MIMEKNTNIADNKKPFDLIAFKKKYGFWESEQRSRIIGERDQAIRDRLHKQEQFKMQTIEGHCYDWYGIICYKIEYLMKQYKIEDEYITDQHSDDYLLPKNNIEINQK